MIPDLGIDLSAYSGIRIPEFTLWAARRMGADMIDEYRRKGYLLRPWLDSPLRKEFVETLRDIDDGRIKPGFHMKHTAHSFRWDLEPRVFAYSDVFLTILAENGIPDLVRQILGPNVSLIRIAIVRSEAPGYMLDWHADPFEPPVHKLIFYPSFGARREKRLEILEGHVKSHSRLPGFQYGSRATIFMNRWEPVVFRHSVRPIHSSDHEFIFMNTRTLHRAFEVSASSGALRILYSFRERFASRAEQDAFVQYADTRPEEIDAVTEQYARLAS